MACTNPEMAWLTTSIKNLWPFLSSNEKLGPNFIPTFTNMVVWSLQVTCKTHLWSWSEMKFTSRQERRNLSSGFAASWRWHLLKQAPWQFHRRGFQQTAGGLGEQFIHKCSFTGCLPSLKQGDVGYPLAKLELSSILTALSSSSDESCLLKTWNNEILQVYLAHWSFCNYNSNYRSLMNVFMASLNLWDIYIIQRNNLRPLRVHKSWSRTLKIAMDMLISLQNTYREFKEIH